MGKRRNPWELFPTTGGRGATGAKGEERRNVVGKTEKGSLRKKLFQKRNGQDFLRPSRDLENILAIPRKTCVCSSLEDQYELVDKDAKNEKRLVF